LIYNVQRQPLQ